MISTRIELTHSKATRLSDLNDLAEVLFPRNRNLQHAFVAIWIALKWSRDGLVPNLRLATRDASVSKRTIERTRAKLHRLGLIDRVSHFNARHGFRDGWILSSRFERCLRQLADKIADLRSREHADREKDNLLIAYADARRFAAESARAARNAESTCTRGVFR